MHIAGWVYSRIIEFNYTGNYFDFFFQIYPEVTRDVGVTLTGLYYSFMTFVLVKIARLLTDSINILATLYLFAALVSVFSIILYFIMPETQQCTLQQVEDEIYKKKLFQKKPNPIN